MPNPGELAGSLNSYEQFRRSTDLPLFYAKERKDYLCERNSILHCNFNATCLSALYDQNVNDIMELCPLTIVPQKEVILLVHSDQYLVSLPKSVTGNIECLNQSNMELFLPKGVSQINVSPTCHTVMPKHVIVSDVSNKPKTNLKRYKWAPDQDFIPAPASPKSMLPSSFSARRKPATLPWMTFIDTWPSKDNPPNGHGFSVGWCLGACLGRAPLA